MSLAERHPDMFRQALSYSGALSYSLPAMQPLLNMSSDVTLCWWGPYGTALNPSRYEQDPALNIGKLKGTDVDIYASAGTGIPEIGDGLLQYVNSPWEIGARILLGMFDLAARAADVPVTIEYRTIGSHNYPAAYRELRRTKPRIMGVLQRAEKRIYGSTSTPRRAAPARVSGKHSPERG